MRKNSSKFPLIVSSRVFVYPLFAAIALCLVFASGAWAANTLYAGSLSTPVLYDSSAYGLQPQSARTPLATVPGGVIATAAWYDFGMKISWDVTDNSNGTYTYHYLFGPGWYPATNPKADPNTTPPTEPYVTNKNITAFDLQMGDAITSLSDLTNLTWNVYQFNGPNGSLVGRIGTGDTTSYQKCSPLTGALTGSPFSTPLLSVGDFTGETGWTDQVTLDEHYTTHNLFHGIQWLNPTSGGNFIFANNINFELTFTSIQPPGWGNFFTNSTRTGGNNNQSNVVAFNSSVTDYSFNMLNIQNSELPYNFTIAVPGGIQIEEGTPPTVDATDPENGATGISIGTSVAASFSELFDPSTATGANFILSNAGDQISGTVSFSLTNKTLTFTPQAPLKSGTSYTAAILTGVKDLRGNNLASEKTWNFTTRAYDIADALRALHITVGLINADANDTTLYDVVHSTASNGTINILDVLLILRRVVEASP
ncbi:MAG: Ig-like domain-containing protein [Geobacteraceae bacterium]|nr:Ig-like domain-containing protein [Geobacteraceae bacterium]